MLWSAGSAGAVLPARVTAECSLAPRAPAAPFPGWIRAWGSIWCIPVHQILPEAPALPVTGAGVLEVSDVGSAGRPSGDPRVPPASHRGWACPPGAAARPGPPPEAAGRVGGLDHQAARWTGQTAGEFSKDRSAGPVAVSLARIAVLAWGLGATTPVLRGMCATTPKKGSPRRPARKPWGR